MIPGLVEIIWAVPHKNLIFVGLQLLYMWDIQCTCNNLTLRKTDLPLCMLFPEEPIPAPIQVHVAA